MTGSKFNFYAEWVKFGDTLQDTQERFDYYHAISMYGAYNEEPKNLRGETLAYFNSIVRPMMDRQRKNNDYGIK